MPDWELLTNIEHFILSANSNLTGALPIGMDSYNKISTIDIAGTKMKSEGDLLFPRTLRLSGQYQLEDLSDNYQCPVLEPIFAKRSSISMNPEYYDHHNCRCLPGSFGLRNICVKCPVNCACDSGLSMKGCFPSPNLENLTEIVICANPSSCETTLSSEILINRNNIVEDPPPCLPGFEGRVCSKCQEGYGTQGRSCVKCQESMIYISFALGPVIILVFIFYLYRSKGLNSGKLSILIFHVQTLSVVAIAMSNTPAVEKSISLPFSISSIQVPNLACVLGVTDAITPMIFSYIRLPILLVLYVVILKLPTGLNNDKVTYVMLNLVRCIYYGITLESLGSFSCTLFDSGYSKWFLNAWPWISCDPSSTEHSNMLAMSIPIFIIFVCGLPACFWWIIATSSHHVNQNKTPQERLSRKTRYGFLYMPYKKEYRYWELVVIARLVCFALVIRIVPYTSQSTIFILLLVVMQSAIWLQHAAHPYVGEVENRMELASLYTIFFSYFLALVGGLVHSAAWIIAVILSLNSIIILVFVWLTFKESLGSVMGRRNNITLTPENLSQTNQTHTLSLYDTQTVEMNPI
eukprot:TRINITY_DN3740_c0_g1_i3.p1 TRINITY_DN3740_c0_g1~~TRINITY_DN3740_c0_g1_i3.p1  ORF type:complete len:577 (+),score=87.13 TRINITY_DN3740_c0_g1_i3:365-2095(+)